MRRWVMHMVTITKAMPHPFKLVWKLNKHKITSGIAQTALSIDIINGKIHQKQKYKNPFSMYCCVLKGYLTIRYIFIVIARIPDSEVETEKSHANPINLQMMP